jgi:hypothetical protein
VSKVTKPIGRMEMTKRMIMLFLDTVSRPARCSEIREAVCRRFPDAPIYGSLGELQIAGTVRRVTMERDALYSLPAATGQQQGV